VAASRKDRYHHGDLKAELVDMAIELIAEKGIRQFSLSEVSRRAGVTTAAPYRHFNDRQELLAAIAMRACHALDRELREAPHITDPTIRAGEIARAWIRFAARNRPYFDTLFSAGLDRERFVDVERAADPIREFFYETARELTGGDLAQAEELGLAIAAVAHGYAYFYLDRVWGTGEAVVESIADKAATAARALAAGWMVPDAS
jgi:AcrR family transcriptional regulator